MFKRTKAILLSALLIFTIAGCSSKDAQIVSSSQAIITPTTASSTPVASSAPTSASSSFVASTATAQAESTFPASETASTTITAGELTVHFGDDGAPFTMYLYENSTAAAIASYVGTADWRLPIYNYDGYDNWEIMQYYDLPSRYEIPSNAETIPAEKAGEVFYSEPNRIVLFYGDGEVTGEYSRIGYFEATEEFVSAVKNNPVLEGWGNKIVLIKD